MAGNASGRRGKLPPCPPQLVSGWANAFTTSGFRNESGRPQTLLATTPCFHRSPGLCLMNSANTAFLLRPAVGSQAISVSVVLIARLGILDRSS